MITAGTGPERSVAEMDGWKKRLTWLRALPQLPDAAARSPRETAEAELAQYLSAHPEKTCVLHADPEAGESYTLTRTGISGGPSGILYGTYRWIMDQELGRPLPAGPQTPAAPLRILNAWDNMDGSIERGYAGRSIWFEGNRFSYDPGRNRQLGRMLASVGINVLCLNNVNVQEPAQGLISERMDQLAAFAALLRPFAVRLMVSADFAQPVREGLETADPLDPGVQAWWKTRAEKIWAAIPDLAGFLIKADSEHRPGPRTYGRNHAQGANMLARAVSPFGGVILWRAFVYNCMQDWRDSRTDRPKAAFDLYMPIDGQFDENVILQVKNGPYDFQVREPLSPLFYGLRKTSLALEVQLAQEYTGHQIDLYAMPPMFREIWDELPRENVRAYAAVSNLGRDDSWTGHPFAALNLYAWGRFAWDPDSSARAVTEDWVSLSYSLPEDQRKALTRLLLSSRETYELYTATLGLDWMVRPGVHYGPDPYGYEFDLWGTYNRADRSAVGVDRTKAGTGYTAQYPAPIAGRFDDPAECPENLLLFFHRLPYGFRMKDGRTLIQRIYDDHFEGCARAEAMRGTLDTLSLPEPDRAEVLERADRQVRNAREWRDVINTFFHRFSGAEDAQGRTIYD